MSVDQPGISYWAADTSEDLLDCTLGALLRSIAAEVPERVALVDGVADPARRRRWTYRELVAISESVARSLLTRFAPGDKVAICAPNCAEWVFLQHGMSFAGLVMVPINPAYRIAEMEVILRTSQAAGIFYADEYRGSDIAGMMPLLASRLPHLRETVSLGQWEKFLAQEDESLPFPELGSGDLLHIQFTSGTTGIPKGACLHHKGVVNTSRFVAKRAGFPDGGVWINAMPMFHIGGPVVTELATITSRGTYVLVPGFDPQLMLELIESERGNATLIVPTMILALLEHPDFTSRDLSSMKTILTGAAVVPAALVHRTKEAFKSDLSILFGQTEVNGVVCQTSIDDSVEDQSETLGKPLPHAEVCIADPDAGEFVPIGATGEIWVRGYQNMLGYYGLEKETRETIRSDGWLRTGDMGVMDERGYFKIAGRIKDMIIRGGMNIYPREIEDVLFAHAQVAQVSVVGIPDERWGEAIAAVVLPADRFNPPPVEELHAHCRAHLAAHKSPVAWYFVDEYPLTPSGKIQKFVLQEWIAEGRLTAVGPAHASTAH